MYVDTCMCVLSSKLDAVQVASLKAGRRVIQPCYPLALQFRARGVLQLTYADCLCIVHACTIAAAGAERHVNAACCSTRHVHR